MIQIILELCQKAGCQPKDLVIEWTPALGARVVGTNAQGVKTSLNILARLDHIAQAIWLCSNGQEHLYPRIQQQQADIDARVKEWVAERADCEQHGGFHMQTSSVETVEKTAPADWRQLNTVSEIMQAFPRHPSPDDIIDLYQRNKYLNSPDLTALLQKHSR